MNVKEKKMIVGLIVASLLLIYLVYTLIKPEKF
jgi:K+-transporting ATPase KdpF subunit